MYICVYLCTYTYEGFFLRRELAVLGLYVHTVVSETHYYTRTCTHTLSHAHTQVYTYIL